MPSSSTLSPDTQKTLNVWVGDSPSNSARLYQALARFGAPLEHDGITPETFAEEEIVYQIGVSPLRIDISNHIDGVTFGAAWQNRVQGSIFGVPVHFISLSDLIANKQSSGRKSDLEHLKRIERESKRNSE